MLSCFDLRTNDYLDLCGTRYTAAWAWLPDIFKPGVIVDFADSRQECITSCEGCKDKNWGRGAATLKIADLRLMIDRGLSKGWEIASSPRLRPPWLRRAPRNDASTLNLVELRRARIFALLVPGEEQVGRSYPDHISVLTHVADKVV